MMRKGQIKRLNKNDAMGQAKFVESLFQIAAQGKTLVALSRLQQIFAAQPYCSAGGCQSSILLPSGSMTHPNFPNSESSVFSSTSQPSSRSA